MKRRGRVGGRRLEGESIRPLGKNVWEGKRVGKERLELERTPVGKEKTAASCDPGKGG